MNKTFIVSALIILVLALGVIWYYSAPKENVSAESVKAEESNKTGYIDVTPEQASALIESNPELVIIDVSSSYELGHLPGAVNYMLGDGSLDRVIPTLDKNKEYLVYCHGDSASIAGAEKLVNAGFGKVYRLKGNYSAWVELGLSVEI